MVTKLPNSFPKLYNPLPFVLAGGRASRLCGVRHVGAFSERFPQRGLGVLASHRLFAPTAGSASAYGVELATDSPLPLPGSHGISTFLAAASESAAARGLLAGSRSMSAPSSGEASTWGKLLHADGSLREPVPGCGGLPWRRGNSEARGGPGARPVSGSFSLGPGLP